MRTLLLLLVLGVPPLVLQLAAPVPRLDADAVEYYSHLRSLYFDHDLDFADEFAHFGILTRGDKVHPTATGHRRTIFSVGPALLWMPFYAAGDVAARFAGDISESSSAGRAKDSSKLSDISGDMSESGRSGRAKDGFKLSDTSGTLEDGYSPYHIRAVCLASLAYGLAGLWLVFRILDELFAGTVASWTCVLLLYATFLFWYVVYEAAVSHALSFFAAALALAVWWPARRDLRPGRALVLGLVLGLGATVRWQNGVLLMLPAATLLLSLRQETGATVRKGVLVLAAFAVGALPQMLAWKAIFGQYLLAEPPHGRDFLRLDHPYLLLTFFSSRHGLLYWTPVLWGGFLGFFLLFRRDRFTTLALAAPLLIMSYVNACSGDWWAGGSFSNRRFDSVLPLLALGLGASLAWVVDAVRRRPMRVAWALGLAFVVWNQLLIVQYREKKIPADDTVSFAAVAEYNAKLVGRYAGTPLAWPANWVFARAHDLPPARYDLMAGKYLFYRQNNLGGLVKVGDGRADPALFAGAWSAPAPCGEGTCREVTGQARVMAPLDVAEDLDVIVHASGRGTLSLAVNGVLVASFPLEGERRGLRAHVPRMNWHRELNDVSLSLGEGSAAFVERVVFERAPERVPGGRSF